MDLEYIDKCVRIGKDFNIVSLHGRYFETITSHKKEYCVIYWKNVLNVIALVELDLTSGRLTYILCSENTKTSNNQVKRNCNKYHTMIFKQLNLKDYDILIETKHALQVRLFNIIKVYHKQYNVSHQHQYVILWIDHLWVFFNQYNKVIDAVVTPLNQIGYVVDSPAVRYRLRTLESIELHTSQIDSLDFNRPKREVDYTTSIEKVRNRELFDTYSCGSGYGIDYTYFVQAYNKIILVITKEGKVYKAIPESYATKVQDKIKLYTSQFNSTIQASQKTLVELTEGKSES